MDKKLREENESFAIDLFHKGWKSSEKESIMEEFSESETDSAAICEIIREHEETIEFYLIKEKNGEIKETEKILADSMEEAVTKANILWSVLDPKEKNQYSEWTVLKTRQIRMG